MISANSMAMRAFSFVGFGAFRAESGPQLTESAEPPAISSLDIGESADDPLARGSEGYQAVAEALAAAGLLDA